MSCQLPRPNFVMRVLDNAVQRPVEDAPMVPKAKTTSSRKKARKRIFVMTEVDAATRKRFDRVAVKLGLTVSSWARMKLLEAAELAEKE